MRRAAFPSEVIEVSLLLLSYSCQYNMGWLSGWWTPTPKAPPAPPQPPPLPDPEDLVDPEDYRAKLKVRPHPTGSPSPSPAHVRNLCAEPAGLHQVLRVRTVFA
jgi:hypothetical protein